MPPYALPIVEHPSPRAAVPGRGSFLWSLARGLFALFAAFLSVAPGAETNSPPAAPAATGSHPLPDSQKTAAAYERAGRKHEAAALYEAMVRTNAAARKVLARRLVTIYAETGETNKALAWAREVMRDNPDPQAYLAAVHGQLGQWQEAKGILEHELAKNTNTTRAVTLRWQLAEVHEKEGDGAKARRILQEAAGVAKGTPMEAAAQRRLDAVKKTVK